MGIQVGGSSAQQFTLRGAILAQQRRIHLGDALVLEDVIEQRVAIGGAGPVDGLIQEHDEETGDRLGEHQLE